MYRYPYLLLRLNIGSQGLFRVCSPRHAKLAKRFFSVGISNITASEYFQVCACHRRFTPPARYTRTLTESDYSLPLYTHINISLFVHLSSAA